MFLLCLLEWSTKSLIKPIMQYEFFIDVKPFYASTLNHPSSLLFQALIFNFILVSNLYACAFSKYNCSHYYEITLEWKVIEGRFVIIEWKFQSHVIFNKLISMVPHLLTPNEEEAHFLIYQEFYCFYCLHENLNTNRSWEVTSN